VGDLCIVSLACDPDYATFTMTELCRKAAGGQSPAANEVPVPAERPALTIPPTPRCVDCSSAGCDLLDSAA
jgi:hypothetical protein